MAAPAAATRKRPAQDEACPAKTHKKKKKGALFSKRYRFMSIYDYEILEEIGEGTYGVVAKARNVRTGATVAIKWIRGRCEDDEADDEPIARTFTREASCLAAHRDHHGVVQLKNVAKDMDTGDLYIVMELGGPSLRSCLTRPFTEDETRHAMRQLLETVDRMHAAGTVHHDINPDNILVGRDGTTLKICGFGCAMPARPFAAGKKVKRLGTLQYRSPEQLNGSQFRGPKDDIWALGCVMAELVAGEPLITAATEEDALDAAVDVRDDIVTMEEEAFDGMGDLSLAGRQLLAGLLAFHSCERLTAADALKHPWFAEDEVAAEPPVAVEAVVESLLPGSQVSSS